MRMSEASIGPRWRLTVWFERSSDFTTFDFDVKPNVRSAAKVVAFEGEQQGRAVEVEVTIERVSVWSLEEISP
jgi:hypothetical protein